LVDCWSYLTSLKILAGANILAYFASLLILMTKKFYKIRNQFLIIKNFFIYAPLYQLARKTLSGSNTEAYFALLLEDKMFFKIRKQFLIIKNFFVYENTLAYFALPFEDKKFF